MISAEPTRTVFDFKISACREGIFDKDRLSRKRIKPAYYEIKPSTLTTMLFRS